MLSAIANATQASQRLAQMLETQEAFFGGFYSGICTLFDGHFQQQKVVGPHSELVRSNALAKLPGNSGLAHSRTNGGGDSCRAQPYIDHFGAVTGMGTGTHGVFSGPQYAAARQSLVDELCAAGVEFNSQAFGISGSAVLKSGASVHNTEIVVQAVAYYLKTGMPPLSAIRTVIERVPAEGAYVFLFRNEPTQLYVANYCMRLLWGLSGKAVQVASSPLALAGCTDIQEVHPNCLMQIDSSAAVSEELDTVNASKLETNVPAGMEEAFLRFVRENPSQPWATIVEKAIVPLFASGRATLLIPYSFRVAEHLLDRGLLRLVRTYVPGKSAEEKVPQFVFEPL
ncbi:MAG: hypothetical protein K1X79_14100 [Oligoflexia bacterium]|nr:hypothetical protein [Oligoflexia bacterium]